MRGMLEWVLWAWIVLDSGLCSAMIPDITDREFINTVVDEHNRARMSVCPPASNMKTMTWDKDLAVIAKAWAQKCLFEHNANRKHPDFYVGENLWAGPTSFDVAMAARAIRGWVEKEKKFYIYRNNSCSRVCGHYTQVVWADSHKVGCAASLCGTPSSWTILVCNYGPGGNIGGSKPYASKDGASCEAPQKRDAAAPSSSHEPTTGAEWAGNSDLNYVAVLVARPVALLLTFAAAHAVRYYYPDIFCYE